MLSDITTTTTLNNDTMGDKEKNISETIPDKDLDPNEPSHSSSQLWERDSGDIPYEARLAIEFLCRGPLVVNHNARNAKSSLIWNYLLTYEEVIQRHFSNMFLRVHIDRENNFACLEQVTSESDSLLIPRLIQANQLNHAKAGIMVFLRHVYEEAFNNGGGRPSVTFEEIRTNPISQICEEDNDPKAYLKTVKKFVEDLKTTKYGILRELGEDGVYEITPVITYLFTSEMIDSFVEYVRKLGETSNLEMNCNVRVPKLMEKLSPQRSTSIEEASSSVTTPTLDI